jgi:spore maturation protein CgeB
VDGWSDAAQRFPTGRNPVPVRILFVGQVAEGQTAGMRMQVLRDLGHEVAALDSTEVWSGRTLASRLVQQRIGRGPAVSRLNEAILGLAREFKPNLFWADKQQYLRVETLEELMRTNIRSLHYTPDPYFFAPMNRSHLSDLTLPLFDYTVTAKHYELEQYERLCRKVIYSPLGFAERVHRPVEPSTRAIWGRFSSDIAFLGVWEPRREAMLTDVANMGCVLKIWGHGWSHIRDGRWTPRRAHQAHVLAPNESFHPVRNEGLAKALQGGEIYADAYSWALTSTKIGIAFLRRSWPDQHTTRSFEIPACATMMLADRTAEHEAMFAEGREAEFFDSAEELVEKVAFYLAHDGARERIALNGYRRCWNSGYSYTERIRRILAFVS